MWILVFGFIFVSIISSLSPYWVNCCRVVFNFIYLYFQFPIWARPLWIILCNCIEYKEDYIHWLFRIRNYYRLHLVLLFHAQRWEWDHKCQESQAMHNGSCFECHTSSLDIRHTNTRCRFLFYPKAEVIMINLNPPRRNCPIFPATILSSSCHFNCIESTTLLWPKPQKYDAIS